MSDTIKTQDIITYTIPKEDKKLIQENARKCTISKSPSFEHSHSERTVFGDQMIGQVTEYASSVILTGSPRGYILAREKANLNPYDGDGGVDIIGLPNINIKGSKMRYSQNPLKYRLPIRPEDRLEGWFYVSVLVPNDDPYKCYLTGWACESDFPNEQYYGSKKTFHGAYFIKVPQLRKISDLLKIIKAEKDLYTTYFEEEESLLV